MGVGGGLTGSTSLVVPVLTGRTVVGFLVVDDVDVDGLSVETKQSFGAEKIKRIIFKNIIQ